MIGSTFLILLKFTYLLHILNWFAFLYCSGDGKVFDANQQDAHELLRHLLQHLKNEEIKVLHACIVLTSILKIKWSRDLCNKK